MLEQSKSFSRKRTFNSVRRNQKQLLNKVSEEISKSKNEENNDSEYFQCSYCRSCFSKKPKLRTHIRKHLNNEKQYCEKCQKDFTTTRNYRRHLKTLSHMQKIGFQDFELFKCETCDDMVFSSRSSLHQHRSRYHKSKGQQKYNCTSCDFSTYLSSSFNRHRQLHNSERGFVCEKCGACFHTHSALKDHAMAVHSQERNYSCEVCGQSFKLKSGLNRHLKTHSDERKFKCFCGQVYKFQSNLTRHMRKSHNTTSGEKKEVTRHVSETEGYEINSAKSVYRKAPQKSSMSVSSVKSTTSDENSLDALLELPSVSDVITSKTKDTETIIPSSAVAEQVKKEGGLHLMVEMHDVASTSTVVAADIENRDEGHDNFDISSLDTLGEVDLSCAGNVLQDDDQYTYDIIEQVLQGNSGVGVGENDDYSDITSGVVDRNTAMCNANMMLCALDDCGSGSNNVSYNQHHHTTTNTNHNDNNTNNNTSNNQSIQSNGNSYSICYNNYQQQESHSQSQLQRLPSMNYRLFKENFMPMIEESTTMASSCAINYENHNSQHQQSSYMNVQHTPHYIQNDYGKLDVNNSSHKTNSGNAHHFCDNSSYEMNLNPSLYVPTTSNALPSPNTYNRSSSSSSSSSSSALYQQSIAPRHHNHLQQQQQQHNPHHHYNNAGITQMDVIQNEEEDSPLNYNQWLDQLDNIF